MIYEMRVYEAALGKMEALHKHFADDVTRFFEKHGMRAIGYWTDIVGTSNRLTYILAFEDLADRERKFAALRSDPEWKKSLLESERDGPTVAGFSNTIMRPTPYSPLQ